MEQEIEEIYLTLLGELEDSACVPGIESAFSPESPCDRAYRRLRDAYNRILLRLGQTDEDADVEDIIHSMLTIQQELCYRMFLLGTQRTGDS